MSRIAIVVSSERADDEGAKVVDVKCDPGGEDIAHASHFAPAGDDALALPGDSVALEESTGAGLEQISGYLDTKNEGIAKPGEKRIYARDADGKVVCEIHLKNVGSVTLKNESGSFELGDDGKVMINGVEFDTDGNIKAPGDVTALATSQAVKLSSHLHPTAMGPTSPPTPGT